MDMRFEGYSELQRLVNSVFPRGISSSATVSRFDVVLRAETMDLGGDLMEVVSALPSRRYTRQRLCDQINSIVTARGWGNVYGTVE